MSVTDKTIIELSEQLQDMANQPTSVNDSVVYRLFDIMDKSLKRQKIDEKALENGAVYIVGTTGSGKSTLLNYLAGRDLKVINDKGKLKLVLMNPNDGLGSIGSGNGESKTVYPLIYQDDRSGLVFIDNPGDQDSRGIAQEILHGYFKHNILQACPIIQILIVTSYHSLAEENGSAFVKYLKHFERSLGDSELMKASISLLFTRVGSLVKVDDILSQLQDILKNQSTNLGESSKILEIIVSQQKIGLFMEPSNDQIEKRYQSPKQDNVGREEILAMLQSGTDALVPDDGLFRVTITETETIRMILTNHLLNAKSLSSFSSHIVNLIKTAFVQRISEFKDVETFLQMDENPIIKTGFTTNTDLKKFFEDQVNMDISQDYSLRKMEFFYRLLGKREFELIFGSINSQFNELGMKQLYNSEPKLEYKPNDSQMILTGFNISADFIQKSLSELEDKKLTQITIQAMNMINFNEDLNFSEFKNHKNAKVSMIARIWNVTKETHLNLSGQERKEEAKSRNDTPKTTKTALKMLRKPLGGETDGLPIDSSQNGQSFLGIGGKLVSKNNKLLISSGGRKGKEGDIRKRLVLKQMQILDEIVPLVPYVGGVYKIIKLLVGYYALRQSVEGGEGGESGTIDILMNDDTLIDKATTHGKSEESPGTACSDGKNENKLLGDYSTIFRMPLLVDTYASNRNLLSELIKSKSQSGISPVPNSEIIDYEKFLTSYFGKKDLAKDIALESLKSFIKRPKVRGDIETGIPLGISCLIDELQFIEDLHFAYLNEEGSQLSMKELASLYELSLAKITEFEQTYNLINQDKVNSQTVFYLYATIFMALNSLKPAHTVVNFEYLQHLNSKKIPDYKEIVKRETNAASKKEYDNNIDQEIQSANKYMDELNSDVKTLNEMLDTQINGLKKDLKDTQEKKKKYAKRMRLAAILKTISNVLKMVGGVVSVLGPYGMIAGGAISLVGVGLDFVTPGFKALSLKELNPTTFLSLREKGEKLFDTGKLISILKTVYDEDQNLMMAGEQDKLSRINQVTDAARYKIQQDNIAMLEAEAPRKKENYINKLIDDAREDPKKFILDNCQELDKKKNEIFKNLTEEQKINFNNGQLERQRFRIAQYATYVDAAVKTASNIAVTVQECLAAHKQTSAAFKDAENFAETQKTMQDFIDSNIQKLEEAMQGFVTSLGQADSHAQIDFIRYGFNEQMQSLIEFFQSALKDYEYSDGVASKALFFRVLNRFDRLNGVMADIQQHIADANDRKQAATLIVAIVQPNNEIFERYSGLAKLRENLQRHLLTKEANDVLYSINQSQFPIAPYYSYDYYKRSLNLKDTEVETVIEGIKLAYHNHQLNKYAFMPYEKYIKSHAEFRLGETSSKGPFTTWQGTDEPAKFAALLSGQRITIVSDIRYSPKGADAIKFRKINLKFQLNSSQDQDFKNELARFNVELISSGEYHYRYNGKYYNIPSASLSLSYAYAGKNGNDPFEKIANGNPIFSPYTTWTIKLTPIKNSTAPDNLYKKFGANISQIELALEGEAQYIDMESYDGQASKDILVNDCYQDFVIEKFEIADV